MKPKAKRARREGSDETDEPMEVEAGPSGLNGGNTVEDLNDDGFGDGDDDLDNISEDEDGGIRVGDIYVPPPLKQSSALDPSAPRLIIDIIRNINFKSYAGTEDLGPFHKSFNAIIGPNGSGKSNVIDALLFVFGYRASKIRSKNISVLIHSSSKYPKCKSATVEVHFFKIIEGENETMIKVPGSDIVISRTAFKDNSSFYTMDGKRVQFKEIAKMLSSHGIDLVNNRFLILQGEVETIAMMKPKAPNEHEAGMLEYLEDIIGTIRYKEPIKKLLQKVDDLTESRKSKLARLRFAEQDWQKFKEPLAQAIDHVNKTNAAIKTTHHLLQKKIHDTKKVIVVKKNEVQNLKDKETGIVESLARTQTKLTEKRELQKVASRAHVELSRKNDLARAKLKACIVKTSKLQAEINDAMKFKRNAGPKLEQAKKKLIDLELTIERNEREITECEALLEQKNAAHVALVAEHETAISEARTRTEAFQAEKDQLNPHYAEMKEKLNEANRTRNLAETRLVTYLSNEETENKKLQKLKDFLAKAENDLEDNRRLREELQASLPAVEENLNEMKARLPIVRNEEARVDTEFQSLRNQLVSSKQAMNANRSRGRVLDALMREKNEGRISGIFGRLGDLGGIDSRYDIAISTCCGPLDHILVDNVNTAHACIDFLKRNNIGFANFIALDKQEHLRAASSVRQTYPENVPRMFDLIRVEDPRVLPAFYFALRDTLVGRDLEQASRIAYARPRRRLVTLEGQLIELSGTMSGGGRPARGRMGNQVQQDTREHDPDAIAENERKCTELEQKLRQLRAEHLSLVENIPKVHMSHEDLKKKIKMHSEVMKHLVLEVASLQEQVSAQERTVVSARVDRAEQASLEALLQEAAGAVREAQTNFDEVQAQMREINDRIAKAGGVRVDDLRKKVNQLTKNIKKITDEIKTLKLALHATTANIKQTKREITQIETTVRQKDEELVHWRAQKRVLADETVGLERNVTEAKEEVDKSADEIKKITEEIDKLCEKEATRKSEKLEASVAVTRKEAVLTEYIHKEAALKKELASLHYEDPGVSNIETLHKIEPFKIYTEEELEQIDVQTLETILEHLKKAIGTTKPNLRDIKDFRAKELCYMKKSEELDAVTDERNRVRDISCMVVSRRAQEFTIGFKIITEKLKQMYQMITIGGDAELELIDSMDAFSEGVIFSVRPPGKSWKNISNLSGGEKTLSSLALVFALHYYKPSPLYVMDEIDAALDFKNVSIVSHYIKERTKNAQFIVISLRYNMFDACDRLVGIYKIDDCTKSVTIDNKLPSRLTHHGVNPPNPDAPQCSHHDNASRDNASRDDDSLDNASHGNASRDNASQPV